MAPRDNLFGRGVRMVVQILVCPRLARMTSPAPFLRYRTDLVADLMPGRSNGAFWPTLKAS